MLPINNHNNSYILDIYTYSKFVKYLFDNLEHINFELINDLYLHMQDLHYLDVINDIFFINIEYILDIFISHFIEYEATDYIPLHIENLEFYDCVESFCYYVDYFVSNNKYFDIYLIILDCLGADYVPRNFLKEF